MEKRFFSGEEIRAKWGITPQMLLNGIKSGQLTPYTTDGAQRVIDMEIHATLKPFSDGKSDTCTRQSAKPLKVNLNNILGFIYPGNEVEGFLESGKESIEDYVRRRRAEGIRDELIACELHDQIGFSHADVARILGLDTDLNTEQHAAVKQRGARKVKEGRKMLKDGKK